MPFLVLIRGIDKNLVKPLMPLTLGVLLGVKGVDSRLIDSLG